MRRISDMRDEILTARARGFTLIEALVVIMVTGIVAAGVAIFMRGTVQSYFDTARRAELSDIADTAARRVARDIQSALPNSVRVSGTAFLELVPIRAAGRYRMERGKPPIPPDPEHDPLDFSDPADSAFDVLGPAVNVANGDAIVIFNMGQPGADVYEGSSRRNAAAPFGALTHVTYSPGGTQFPFASPGARFQVVNTAVSYACDLANGRLWRYSRYAIQAVQPASIIDLDNLDPVEKSLVASNLTACSFSYTAGTLERNGLVVMRLAITEQGETVTLQHQIGVVNTP